MSKQTRFVKVFLPFYDSHVLTASRRQQNGPALQGRFVV